MAGVDPTNSADDHLLARNLAQETGQLLVDLRSRLVAQGVAQIELKDQGDLAAHRHIIKTLTTERPDDAVLSEEGVDNTERLDAKRVWIVDPLDGTREFSEPPRIDWAVHICLVVDGEPVVGAVCLPAEGIVLDTGRPATLPTPSSKAPRVIVSRTRRPAPAQRLAEELGASYIEMGSAGAKAMAVVRGVADIYAHSGGQYEWDSAAPVAVARAAGLHTSRLDGSALEYNRQDPYLPDLLICRPEWADQSLEILNR